MVFTGIQRKASDVVAPQLKRVKENTPALRSMRSMVHEGHHILTSQRPWREFGDLLHRICVNVGQRQSDPFCRKDVCGGEAHSAARAGDECRSARDRTAELRDRHDASP